MSRSEQILELLADAGANGLLVADIAGALDEDSNDRVHSLLAYLRKCGKVRCERGTEGRGCPGRWYLEGGTAPRAQDAPAAPAPAAAPDDDDDQDDWPRQKHTHVNGDQPLRRPANAMPCSLLAPGERASDALQPLSTTDADALGELPPIDRGVQLSAVQRKASRYEALAARMQPGDSVLLEDIAKAGALSVKIRKLGGKAAHRRQPDGRVRVWRMA
jgi:hypothetical protein